MSAERGGLVDEIRQFATLDLKFMTLLGFNVSMQDGFDLSDALVVFDHQGVEWQDMAGLIR